MSDSASGSSLNSSDVQAQIDALNALSVAYEEALDFTKEVLRIAFGSPLPPLNECKWPPSRFSYMETHLWSQYERSTQKAVSSFLRKSSDALKTVLSEIKKSQRALLVSKFERSRDLIVVDPLQSFWGGYLGLSNSDEIINSAGSEHYVLLEAIKQITFELMVLNEARELEAGCLTKFAPEGREAMVLIAMFENKICSPECRKSQPDILKLALGSQAASNDNKRVFKKVQDHGCIAKGENGYGFYLTQSGKDDARRLTESG